MFVDVFDYIATNIAQLLTWEASGFLHHMCGLDAGALEVKGEMLLVCSTMR